MSWRLRRVTSYMHAFECGCADDGAGPDWLLGSHVYKINTWLWNFWLPLPLWPKLRISDRSPGLRLPSTDKPLSRLRASDFTWYMFSIYMVYTWYIQSHIKTCLLGTIVLCPEMPSCVHAFPVHPTSIATLKACKTWMLQKLVYVRHILCIYIYCIYHELTLCGFEGEICYFKTFLPLHQIVPNHGMGLQH
jgi:hypothetical protein